MLLFFLLFLLQKKNRGSLALLRAVQSKDERSLNVVEYFLTHFPDTVRQWVDDGEVSLAADVCI